MLSVTIYCTAGIYITFDSISFSLFNDSLDGKHHSSPNLQPFHK